MSTGDTEGEIPGALVIDRNVLEWRLDPASEARLPIASYDAWIIVVCNEGYASSLAAASLQQLGIERATDLDGGYRAWRAQGLPTTARRTAAHCARAAAGCCGLARCHAAGDDAATQPVRMPTVCSPVGPEWRLVSLLSTDIWTDRIKLTEWQPGNGAGYTVTEPATGDDLGRIGTASVEDVTRAADVAARAQQEWAQAGYQARAAVLRKAGDLWLDHAAEIHDWLIREAGSIGAQGRVRDRSPRHRSATRPPRSPRTLRRAAALRASRGCRWPGGFRSGSSA